MSSSEATTQVKSVPDTLILIFGIVVFAWLLTYFVAPGSFETETVSYEYGGKVNEKVVLKSGSYQQQDEVQPSPIFSASDDRSLLSFAFNGLTSGSKYGAAIGVMMFIILIGGAFGIIMQTKAIDKGLLRVIKLIKGNDILIVPILALLFSLGGAIFGMGEEAIVFAIIVTPIMISLGYDSITAVMCTYVATQIGFASSWMNPFNVAIGQGLAGVAVMSGSGFRFIMWSVFTTVLILFSVRYARTVKAKPELSPSPESNQYFKEHHDLTELPDEKMTTGEILVLLTLTAGIIWVIWGVLVHGYYIPEIATQFFVTGIVAGVIAVIFKVNNFRTNTIAESFRQGAADLLPAALVVGFAQGILAVLGGTNPETPSVLNTILHHTAGLLEGFSETVSAISMFLFQAVFNFFVASGSGQAALTMPLMAPIADLVGVTRQVAVLTFQLGDGLTNIFVPTSAALMGTLGVTKIEWSTWAKFISKFLLLNFVLAIGFIIVAIFIGYE